MVPRRAEGGVDTKKKTLVASERDEEARAGALWAGWREQLADIPAERWVFVDETGTSTRMTPLYAVAPRGQRAYGKVPRNHTRHTTLICALTLDGLQAPMVVEGVMNRETLVAWIGWGLAPTLVPGQIVVLDNLNVHLGPLVRAAVEACGCVLAFLPAYSPDLMPIEGAYSKVKQGQASPAAGGEAHTGGTGRGDWYGGGSGHGTGCSGVVHPLRLLTHHRANLTVIRSRLK